MKFAFRTDVGRKRQSNQDSVGVFENEAGAHIAVVADGMGGHQGGDVASEMVVSHLGDNFRNNQATNIDELVRWLVFELNSENKRILETAHTHANLSGMGTTFVATLMVADTYIVANIGDSRCYRLRENQLKQLTEDHSLVNELVKHGDISPEDAKNHPQKNLITRSLGISKNVDADVTIFHSYPQDYLLLCSDGLTNMVSDIEIQTVLESDVDLQTKCDRLIDLANTHGGLDNITALLIYDDSQVDAS
ncbi:Stp1/IreP family PP2C-type Ser/Thr phosphatase [Agrilactobacillus fermenti]|uniref:Stp1/IreP family PP2C-type Ser/Thr phosphatase n=1 Tax=Agrilactobacillus fermenti TaxID=2586909 RepID=UPI001E5D295B|nr:Stp1/IreP family PP2C-type Ser/Thr phosphatase [Agrilactobacillus fermenti]MCD2256222.1 Stp1/IreP family PP2C-type Ser/Thr phosphatase [Agrilactobacillus fermenti]